jgi:hypothetical protein
VYIIFIKLFKFYHFKERSIILYYSYSCGYKKAFEQYVTLLKQKYPELHIEGENFNPSGYNMFLAKTMVITFIV